MGEDLKFMVKEVERLGGIRSIFLWRGTKYQALSQ
jgi:hypothetical protein